MPGSRKGCVVALALVVTALAGCGTDEAVKKRAALVDIPRPIATRILWEAKVGASWGYVFAPAVSNGALYAAGNDGRVARFDAATGREVWRVDTGTQLSAGVGAGAGVVAVGSPEGEVIAIDADGTPRWRARVSSEVLVPPLVTGELVVVRSGDNRVFAFDIRDGKRRWVYQRSSPPLTVRSPDGMVAARGLIFAGFPGGKLVALVPTNGAVRWEATVAQPHGTTEIERITDVIGFPWISDREICAAAYQGRIGCFDIATGNPQWARELSSSTGPDGDAGYVFVSDEKGAVYAFDRAAGRSIWKQDRLAWRQLPAPLPLGRDLVVGDVEGYVHWLARDTGALVARLPTDDWGISVPPVRIDRGFVVQNLYGGLYAMTAD